MSSCRCAVPDPTVNPIGGQGQSARCSRIFWCPCQCGSAGQGIILDGTPPWGKMGSPPDSKWFSEQVTRIEIDQEVASKRYGHDKSFCAQDSTKGLASWNGRIQTRVQCVDPAFSFNCGDTVWLCIYPLGVSNDAYTTKPIPQITGYAEITRAPIIMGLENGDPIERNYEFNSKGWWNMPSTFAATLANGSTFDCCGCCQTDGCQGLTAELGSGIPGSTFAQTERFGGLTQKPVTVYQWTDKGEWTVSYDECQGSFMPGPMPTEAGKFIGEMRFQPCQSA